MKELFVLIFILPLTLSETCCSVKDLTSPTNPAVSGRYILVGHSSSLKTINSRCSSGCVYVKQGDTSDTQYCFQPSQQGTSSCSKNCENSWPPQPVSETPSSSIPSPAGSAIKGWTDMGPAVTDTDIFSKPIFLPIPIYFH